MMSTEEVKMVLEFTKAERDIAYRGYQALDAKVGRLEALLEAKH